MTPSKPSKLRVAIIVDPMGTYTGPSAEEEVAQYKKEFVEFLKPAKVSFQELYTFNEVRPNTDLIVYDYGGMLPGSSAMEDNARRIVEWARDNPSSLVVVMSTHTMRNYIENTMDDFGVALPNIVCGVGADVEDPIPEWFRKLNGLSALDMDAIGDIRFPSIPEPIPETKPEPEPVPEPEPDQEIQQIGKLTEPIGYITVPVYCDWRPKQTTGSLRFKLADSIVDVTVGEGADEKRIASIGGTFFGFYECSVPNDKGSSWVYSISPRDFWAQFEKLHEEFKEKDL